MTDGLRCGLVWRRSSACESGACVEVATTDDAVMVRNSANPGGMVVTLRHEEWQEFLAGVKEGSFDLR
ncbi:MAG: DUF397 domain-containing protein [Streptosporangiaceae bacterium]|jgi:hypothetical protein